MNESDDNAAGDRSQAGLRRNIELKARLPSLERARKVAFRLATDNLGIQNQVDTYFECPKGRLKLREINDRAAQLIWYCRSDRPEARECDYYLVDVADPAATKKLLTAAWGVRQIVVKRREIFLFRNVRIHLDHVEGLGSFLEFEAVLSSVDDSVEGHQQLAWLSQQFEIDTKAIQSCSYGDMEPSTRAL
jgi:predicted adenylyl cyclase CyaB